MIDGSIGGGSLDDVLAEIRRRGNPDLTPLAQSIRECLIEGNREGLLAGTDADGVPMAPLADSTIRRGRGGFGPPTVPRFSGSQLVDRFRAKVEPKPEGGFHVRAGWPGVEQVKYLRSGTRNMPRRNPAGIRPTTRQRIRELVNAFAAKLRVRF